MVATVPGIRFVYFDESDVVRHPLVQNIIKAYEKYRNGHPAEPAALVESGPAEPSPPVSGDADHDKPKSRFERRPRPRQRGASGA